LPAGIYNDTLRIRDSKHGISVSIALHLMVQTYVPPRPTYRSVTLPVLVGAKTDPLGGWYYWVESRDTFTFLIIPDEGYTLEKISVTTGLPWRDNDDYIVLKYNEDGTVKVILYMVNENITITISGVQLRNDTGNSPPDDSPTAAWSHSGNLHATTPQPQQLRIYSVLGTLVESRQLPPGETVIPLPKGIYIVRIGNMARKVIVK
ncbi:MAG: T9SS type A sorting domain-containing protein, partial [Tannerella sp.]|nr:T9SS type A sorting domain-containing protein [Tannerella sp.]